MILKKAFSLVELLISLIIISLITTFLAPVLTKKLKYQNATISSNPPSLDCVKFDKEGRCLMCNKTCTLCTTQLEQLEGKFVYPPLGCDYKDCSIGCKKCDFKGCIACYEGYGFDSSAKTCLKCRSDEYSLGGVEVCKKCPINCLACKNETKCIACRELYNLNNGKCELGNCVKVDNICVARFNAGDSGGLNIPNGLVEIRGAAPTAYGGEKGHGSAICWRGVTAKNCNFDNGGYNGCTRTVCTWSAANKICAYHGWRLPTSNELKKFNAYSSNKGIEGLQLCAGSGNAACSLVANCNGSFNNNCDPQFVWAATKGTYGYVSGLNMLISSYPESHAFSVRCVRNL